jgi:hypothetical protein
MAGALTISTLNNDTGVLATQNGMTGIAKAWVNFDGTSATPITPRAAFNVGSITKNGTGDYTVNFTTAMPNANYSAQVSAQITASSYLQVFMFGSNGPTLVNPTSSGFRFWTANYNAATTNADSAIICVAVFSS